MGCGTTPRAKGGHKRVTFGRRYTFSFPPAVVVGPSEDLGGGVKKHCERGGGQSSTIEAEQEDKAGLKALG